MRIDHTARRSFVSGLGAAVAAFAVGSRTARAQTSPARFQPARHPEDAWLDALPGRHRTFIDCATPGGAAAGVLYANNLYVANNAGYKLTEKDLAIVVCLRHFATVFAYNDAIWKKYGKSMSELVQFTDPKTKQPPSSNLLNSADYGMTLPNMGNTIPSIVKRGTHFAVCDMATRFITGEIAKSLKASPEELYKEFSSNLVPSSHMVAAGVVAVNRSQEYGYTLLSAL